MHKESHPRSVRLNHSLDPIIERVLRAVGEIARSIDCDYFIAGATARDLVLSGVHGLPPGRATRDIDFGIAVPSWAEFKSVKERLVASKLFMPEPKRIERLMYVEVPEFQIPIDLIPFGGVSDERGFIAWPPRQDVVLNVSGFQEAFQASLQIDLGDGFLIRVASLVGLALMKTIAWLERGSQNNKDASDLFRLLSSYSDAGQIDRLYDDELELLDANGFDVQIAGAELLGRDVVRICTDRAATDLRRLFESSNDVDRLVSQMTTTVGNSDGLTTAHRLVQAFGRGVLAKSGR